MEYNNPDKKDIPFNYFHYEKVFFTSSRHFLCCLR